MTADQPPIRWGISSTGKIAGSMTTALNTIADAEVVAVGSRSLENATEFANTHSIPRAHASFAELCADDDIDVIYVASPHSEHHAMTIAALDAGKHVLCEKAFAMTADQASEMIEAARRNDRFLMEAMWSWFMPGWHELRARIDDGAIGEVTIVDANFGIPIDDEDGRHRRLDLGGGALLDLGIYPLSIGRFLLGEPVDVKVVGRLTDQGVDSLVGGAMRHESGAVTVFSTTLDAMSDLSARITGTAGSIVVHAPFWYPSSFTVTASGESEVVEVPNRGLAHEAEHVIECLRTGRIESPIQTWSATMSNMRLLDKIRGQIGVVFPGETPG